MWMKGEPLQCVILTIFLNQQRKRTLLLSSPWPEHYSVKRKFRKKSSKLAEGKRLWLKKSVVNVYNYSTVWKFRNTPFKDKYCSVACRQHRKFQCACSTRTLLYFCIIYRSTIHKLKMQVVLTNFWTCHQCNNRVSMEFTIVKINYIKT
jgi:hypothetical protein